MQDWKAINIEGISRIERVAAIFEVTSIGKFPHGHVKIKILEMPSGRYLGVVNMAAKEKKTGSPDWAGARSDTITEALENSIRDLLRSIAQHEAVSEEDFEWAAPEDF